LIEKIVWGKKVNFEGRKESLELFFGKKALAPSEMDHILWEFIKNIEYLSDENAFEGFEED